MKMKEFYNTQDRSLAALVKAMRVGRRRYLLIHGLIDSLVVLAIVVGLPIIWDGSDPLSLMYIILAVVLLPAASFLVVNWEWNRKELEARRLGIIGLDIHLQPTLPGTDVDAATSREHDGATP
jgi:hypothetical protein